MSAESIRAGATAEGNRIIQEHQTYLSDNINASVDQMRQWQGVVRGVKLMQDAIDAEYRKNN